MTEILGGRSVVDLRNTLPEANSKFYLWNPMVGSDDICEMRDFKLARLRSGSFREFFHIFHVVHVPASHVRGSQGKLMENWDTPPPIGCVTWSFWIPNEMNQVLQLSSTVADDFHPKVLLVDQLVIFQNSTWSPKTNNKQSTINNKQQQTTDNKGQQQTPNNIKLQKHNNPLKTTKKTPSNINQQ